MVLRPGTPLTRILRLATEMMSERYPAESINKDIKSTIIEQLIDHHTRAGDADGNGGSQRTRGG